MKRWLGGRWLKEGCSGNYINFECPHFPCSELDASHRSSAYVPVCPLPTSEDVVVVEVVAGEQRSFLSGITINNGTNEQVRVTIERVGK